jgi:hypothetical protein
VPLTPFQQAVARLLSSQRTPDSYLAGGAALHIEPNSIRYSNDLDYFNDSTERVASAFAADRQALHAAGYSLQVSIERNGFVRAIAGNGTESTKIEWVHDTAWRFLPAVHSDVAGYCLHPIDLAINKILALVCRDEPRDFLDTLHVHNRILSLGALVWAAVGKDPGFTPPMLLGMLRRRGRYHSEDFARLRLVQPAPSLPDLKLQWLDALDQAAQFIASRASKEVGCLYFSPSLGQFPRLPEREDNLIAHYGCPGGAPRQLDA